MEDGSSQNETAEWAENKVEFIIHEESNRLQGLILSDATCRCRRTNHQRRLFTPRLGELKYVQTESCSSVVFTKSNCVLNDIEDDDSFLPTNCCNNTDINTLEEHTLSYPQEQVYLEVHPTLLSLEDANTTFIVLRNALLKLDLHFETDTKDASIKISDLIHAEEVIIQLEFYRGRECRTKVDFHRIMGDEKDFLYVVESIRSHCRSIDQELQSLPDLRFDLFQEWALESYDVKSGPQIGTNSDEIALLLTEINSDLPFESRIQVARQIKNLCQSFENGLESMVFDPNAEIVRFGLYCILLLTADDSSNRLDLFWLHTALDYILLVTSSPSTRKLALKAAQTILR